MNIVTLNREFLTAKLNEIKPHSRLRPGIVHILQHLNNLELQAQQIDRECGPSALERAFADDPEFMQRVRETY